MQTFRPLAFLLACATATGALAVDGNMLKTMPHGAYECALPGNAAGPAWEPVAGAGFRLGVASSYTSPEGRGVYLLKGKEFAFTRGPKKGERYLRTGENELQAIGADGVPGRMRCVRVSSGR